MPLVTRLVQEMVAVIFIGSQIPQVLQRIYKYGGQPFARDYLAKHHGTDFDNAFGKGTGKAIMHATAGRFVCWGYGILDLVLTVYLV